VIGDGVSWSVSTRRARRHRAGPPAAGGVGVGAGAGRRWGGTSTTCPAGLVHTVAVAVRTGVQPACLSWWVRRERLTRFQQRSTRAGAGGRGRGRGRRAAARLARAVRTSGPAASRTPRNGSDGSCSGSHASRRPTAPPARRPSRAASAAHRPGSGWPDVAGGQVQHCRRAVDAQPAQLGVGSAPARGRVEPAVAVQPRRFVCSSQRRLDRHGDDRLHRRLIRQSPDAASTPTLAARRHRRRRCLLRWESPGGRSGATGGWVRHGKMLVPGRTAAARVRGSAACRSARARAFQRGVPAGQRHCRAGDVTHAWPSAAARS
jgi:hypothetical protein